VYYHVSFQELGERCQYSDLAMSWTIRCSNSSNGKKFYFPQNAHTCSHSHSLLVNG